MKNNNYYYYYKTPTKIMITFYELVISLPEMNTNTTKISNLFATPSSQTQIMDLLSHNNHYNTLKQEYKIYNKTFT